MSRWRDHFDHDPNVDTFGDAVMSYFTYGVVFSVLLSLLIGVGYWSYLHLQAVATSVAVLVGAIVGIFILGVAGLEVLTTLEEWAER
jgi:uncharacterized Tic20 family protein